MVRRRAPIHPNVPSWARGFVNAIYAFKAARDVDKIVEVNIAVEVEVLATKVVETPKRGGGCKSEH